MGGEARRLAISAFASPARVATEISSLSSAQNSAPLPRAPASSPRGGANAAYTPAQPVLTRTQELESDTFTLCLMGGGTRSSSPPPTPSAAINGGDARGA